ncbi:DUF1467 family protein [Parvibaculum sp.]|uniref:DUF1467 family protein n=1 Tax=Parvibaculum sp. TaxID=2024848 RepID=UPI000C97F4AC|nr:DUF1467 family protein [Parvibaculum sp.]MAB15187.1 hypothetical protein [Parvibaculum sp.]
MSWFAGIAIYFVIWWITLLAVLPFRGNPVAEEDLREGHDPGAPARTLLLWKVIATTIIAGILWCIVAWVMIYQPISYDDIPFMPKFSPEYNEPVTPAAPAQQPGN